MTEEKRGLDLEIYGSELAKIQGLGPQLRGVACVDAIIVETDHNYAMVEHDMHRYTAAEINKVLFGEVLLKTESDHGSDLTVESEYGSDLTAESTECNKCGEIFDSVADLHQHSRTHKDLDPYICAHCGKSFAAWASIMQHMQIYRKEKAARKKRRLTRKRHLKKHQRIQSGDEPYKCNQCRTGSVHMCQQVHARAKPYTCTLCSKGYSHYSSLWQHHKTHHESRVHSAPPSGKAAFHSITAKPRIQQSQKAKPYTCNHCDKAFNQYSSLFRHQSVHMEERRQQQQQQQQQQSAIPSATAISNTATLQRDILGGGKPYRCSQCSKGFGHSSSLSRHRRIHK